VRPPGRTTSPASNRSIPRPPPAAPVAGGRGIVDSRRVNSVGTPRLLAGGAMKVEVRSEKLLQAMSIPFYGGVRWSAAAGRRLSSRSWSSGTAVRVVPLPDPG